MAQIVPLTSRRYDYRPDIQLRITPDSNNGKMQLEVIHDDGYQLPLDINQKDAALLAETLQERLQDVSEAVSDTPRPRSEDLRESLEALATAGHRAFQRLLCGGETVTQLIQLEEKRANGRPLVIQITSPGFAFPWELLYPRSLESKPAFEHFWGFHFVISRIVCRPKSDTSRLNNEIQCSPRLRLGVVLDSSLKNVGEREFPYFQTLEAQQHVKLFRLDSLSPGSRRQGILKFKDFLGRPLHVAHFACHGKAIGKTKGLQEITIDDDFHITVEEMEADAVSFSNNPLVIMNNCESGNVNPQYTFHFADYFLNSGGARGLVATECEIPDEFAASFSRQLYDRLLNGKPLGEAMLRSRQHFLKEYSNPLGLAYCAYAPPSIRFALAKEVLAG
jgi:hypothetical protein